MLESKHMIVSSVLNTLKPTSTIVLSTLSLALPYDGYLSTRGRK